MEPRSFPKQNNIGCDHEHEASPAPSRAISTVRDDDDDVRAWIVIGLIAFACLLVGWLPMLSAIRA